MHPEELQRSWFPATPPSLAPYLGSLDDFGNSAIQPGSMFPSTPFDVAAERSKHWVSSIGLRYSLEQTMTFVAMSDVMQGDNTLGF